MKLKFRIVKIERGFGEVMAPLVDGGGRRRQAEEWFLHTLEALDSIHQPPTVFGVGSWQLKLCEPLQIGAEVSFSLVPLDA